jgi:hypothetical protein
VDIALNVLLAIICAGLTVDWLGTSWPARLFAAVTAAASFLVLDAHDRRRFFPNA